MKYRMFEDRIEILDDEDFVPEHILECGQVFSYIKHGNGDFQVFSKDMCAEILKNGKGWTIATQNPEYFEKYFDLKTDYALIKNNLSGVEIMAEPIKFGHGIRILKQDLFECLISFIISANNNIKRIQLILWRLREKLGKNMGNFHAFPTHKQLLGASEEFFFEIGAGYRAPYLFKVLRQVDEKTLLSWKNLPTKQLRGKLIELAGVGPKVADCVLLFGFGRGDVFPVDTWIEKMYHKFYDHKNFDYESENAGDGAKIGSREKIRDFLTGEFGEMSGFAQQYLFFFMRSGAV